MGVLTDALQDLMDECDMAAIPQQTCASRGETLLEQLRSYRIETVKQSSLQQLIRRAKLKLFTWHAQSGASEQATAVLTDIVAVAPLNQDELLELGPTHAKQARSTTQYLDLKARGTLEVSCNQPCAVAVNDTQVDNRVRLPIGSYRLVVVGLGSDLPALSRTVELKYQGQQKKLSFPEQSEPTPTPAPSETAENQPVQADNLVQPPATLVEQTEMQRFVPHHGPVVVPILPRRVMQIGMTSALVVSAAGSMLWSMDGICTSYQKNKITPQGDVPCLPGKGLNSKAAGISILGVGAATLLAGSALLTAERVKGRRAQPTNQRDSAADRELSVRTAGRGARLRRRHFPRWFELAGAGLGLAGIVSGAITLGFDGKRVPGEAQNYDNKPQGIALMVGGAQFLVFSTIFLAIDEWPRTSKRKIAPQGLGFRF